MRVPGHCRAGRPCSGLGRSRLATTLAILRHSGGPIPSGRAGECPRRGWASARRFIGREQASADAHVYRALWSSHIPGEMRRGRASACDGPGQDGLDLWAARLGWSSVSRSRRPRSRSFRMRFSSVRKSMVAAWSRWTQPATAVRRSRRGWRRSTMVEIVPSGRIAVGCWCDGRSSSRAARACS